MDIQTDYIRKAQAGDKEAFILCHAGNGAALVPNGALDVEAGGKRENR
ncbi:hypothetical protein [Paenibacillus alvei]|nr:hypothetical protein [Paenibacillus alvei]MCY7484045.1 hypothetical protein [Paenibacillus alvei]